MTHNTIAFVDIETAPEFETLSQVPEPGRKAFTKRFFHKAMERVQHVDLQSPDAGDIADHQAALDEIYKEEAAFMPEYSRIVCISMGYIYQKDTSKKENPEYLRVKSFVGDHDPASENLLLTEFTKACKTFDFLCAHNGKGFDFPFIIRRLIIKRIEPPRLLANLYKKPWEVPLIDTAEMWTTTNKRQMISLDMIAYCLGIPSPKMLMDGSMVGEYFKAGKFTEIKEYCQVDIITLVNSYLSMINRPVITPEFTEYAA